MDEEQRRRHREALEIHDNVVQGLAMAKLSLELGEVEAGMAALEETLEAARRLVTDLLGEAAGDEEVVDLTAGVLRRDTPAGLG
jgi:signal transduction histidine kinase